MIQIVLQEKKPYQEKAAELKAAYEKALKSNNTDADNANVCSCFYTNLKLSTVVFTFQF